MGLPTRFARGEAAVHAPGRSIKVSDASLLARRLHAGCQPERSGGVAMHRLVARLGFHTRFALRRIDRIAGEVNAFLIAMALGLGMLDPAYVIEQVVGALPKR
jgi:hypothetical protein